MKQVIARIEKGKRKFEIVVDGIKAWKWKMGEIKDIREVLIVEEIFKDARKGDVASRSSLKEVFGTEDVLKVAETILKEGEVPMPVEIRRELTEKMKKRIINFICTNAVDPRTKTPIPPSRIEAAMEKAGVHIDPFKPFEKQVEEVIKKIREIIPLKFEKRKIEVKIPPSYSGKIYGFLKKYKILRENWSEDGSLICLIEIPAGLIDEFISEISSKTKGNSIVRVVE